VATDGGGAAGGAREGLELVRVPAVEATDVGDERMSELDDEWADEAPVRLARPPPQALEPAARAVLAPGSRVRVCEGPLRGAAAEVLLDGIEGGHVAISLEGTGVAYKLPSTSLEPLGPSAGAGSSGGEG